MLNLYIASCEEDGGIYRCEVAKDIISLKEKTQADRPMYLQVKGDTLYAVLREAFEKHESGICSYPLDREGCLQEAGSVVSTKGEVACHLCVDHDTVYAANYISGSLAKLSEKCCEKVVVHQGKGTDPKRQEKPHLHFVGFTPDKRYLCAVDLGLDRICFYDRELTLQFFVSVSDGSGARHIVFSEDGSYLYCANELASTVTVFQYEGENTRALATYSTIPEDFDQRNNPAAIRVSKNRLYVSNRGHDSIAVFDILGERLELAEYIMTGKEPRDFNIFGHILVSCNLFDDTVTFYDLEDHNRLLQTLFVPSPLCVVGKTIQNELVIT